MLITSYMLATSMLLCSLVVAIATAGGEYEYSTSVSELSHEYVDSTSQKVEDKSVKVKVTTSPLEKKVNFPVSYDSTKTTMSRKPLRADCEGLVLCKLGQNFYPIKGAKASITCTTVNEFGYEVSPASTYTSKTNRKGYFLMPIPQMKFVSNYLKFTNCKVQILHSVSEKCKTPFNYGNKWKSVSTYLSTYRFLKDRKVRLYTVGPFLYTEDRTATPTGY